MASSPVVETPLRLLVGLGNPGIEYAGTPHNFGYLLVDEVARRADIRIALRECQALTGRLALNAAPLLLAKPETYMNLSGAAVRELLRKYEWRPEQALIVYDDIDLPLGAMRLRERGSAGTHNGLRSVLGSLQTREIPRLRLGIRPDHPVGELSRFVLSPWKKAQLAVVHEVLLRAADAVEMIVREGFAAAMTRYNTPAPGAEAGPGGTPRRD